MVFVNTTLLNFPQVEVLLSILGEYPGEFEYSVMGIFRRTVPPSCPECGIRMNHNGYSSYSKIGLDSARSGGISWNSVIPEEKTLSSMISPVRSRKLLSRPQKISRLLSMMSSIRRRVGRRNSARPCWTVLQVGRLPENFTTAKTLHRG